MIECARFKLRQDSLLASPCSNKTTADQIPSSSFCSLASSARVGWRCISAAGLHTSRCPDCGQQEAGLRYFTYPPTTNNLTSQDYYCERVLLLLALQPLITGESAKPIVFDLNVYQKPRKVDMSIIFSILTNSPSQVDRRKAP